MSLEYVSGHWNVIYWPTGRHGRKIRFPVPVAIQDRPAAQAFHDQYLAEWRLTKSLTVNPRPLTGYTVARLWDEYMIHHKMYAAKTTHQDVKYMGERVRQYIGMFNAEDFSAHMITIYMQRPK